MGIRRAAIARERVLVADDSGQIKDARRDLPHHHEPGVALDLPQVDQEQVRVGSPVGDDETVLSQRAREVLRVLDDAPLQCGERRLLGQLERDCQGGELVHVRPALLAGEDGRVDARGDLRIRRQEDGSASAAQRLVGREGHDVGVPDRVRIHLSNDQPGGVSDVGEENGADLVGDLAELGPVGLPGV